MSWGRRACVLFSLGILITTPLLSAAQAAEGSGAGYVCYPDASGSGWVCDQDQGQKPPRTITEVKRSDVKQTESSEVKPDALPTPVPATTRPDPQAAPPGAADAKRAAAIAATDALSEDPADWYTPTSPRPPEPSHLLHADLAEAYYQRETDPAGYCAGSYVLREFPHPATEADENFPIVAEADELSAILDVEANLQGNVTVTQGNRQLVTSNAVLAYDTRIAQFPDGVRMDQPGLIMQGERATVALNSKAADLDEVQFLLTEPQIRGAAGTMQQSPNGDLTLTRTAFTRCEPGNNGWRLQSRSLEIEKDAIFGTARGAVLRLKSVPVFYSPYMQFPVSDERVSGFLFPNLSYSDEDGVDVSIPYYFNLAPNYDATVIPRYLSKRGAGAELELRHMSGWQETTLAGALLPQDDIYNGTLDRDDFDELGGEPVLGPFEPADRWLGSIDHAGRLGPLRTFAEATMVSDADYFRDLGSDLGVSSRVELERRGGVAFNRGGLAMRLWGQSFQRLDLQGIEEYQRLPELQMSYGTDLIGPLEASIGARLTEFERDTDGLNGIAAITGRRTHLEPQLRLPMIRTWGFATLTGGYRHTEYDLEQDSAALGAQLVDDNPDRGIGFGSLDTGLFFERELNWFNTGLIQTLEPRIYYLYQEFEDQSALPVFDATELTFSYSQLYRANRFSGLDRFSNANQASAGVTTRFINEGTGSELFRFSVGEIYYFEDRRVTLTGAPTAEARQHASAIASEVSARLFGHWNLTGNVVWDQYDNEVEEGGGSVQYRRDNRHIFNLGFRKQRLQKIEQTDVALYWPLTRNIAVLGRWNYDLVSNRTIEGFGGLEYSDCCLQVRLIARRFLDSRSNSNFADVEADEGVFLQIVFKGLAGFGTKVESVLERGIRGYRAPAARDFMSN